MDLQPATITIQNLRLRTFIGFNEEERQKLQDVVINADISYTLPEPVLRDDVDHVLDYKTVCKNIINHVENHKFLLLEKLAADILTICLASSQALHARVCVNKPHALRFADSVAITLSGQKKDA